MAKYRKKTLQFKEGIDSMLSMPVIQNAKKALRQSKTKTTANRKAKAFLGAQVEKLKKEKSLENLGRVFSAIDKLAKNNVVHPNKAGRLKRKFSKLIPVKTPAKSVKPAVSSKKTSLKVR